MKNLVLAMFMSLDGYIEGPDRKLVPPPWSAEVAKEWVKHNLDNAGHLIYGRVNFEFNKGYWTSPAAAGQPETEIMNRLPKTVMTRTLSGDPGWNGVVAKDGLAAVVAQLKTSVTGGDLYSFGGAGLAKSLMEQSLVDEYYLMISAQMFGGGKRLFESGLPRVDLTLIEAKVLDVGSLILHYRQK